MLRRQLSRGALSGGAAHGCATLREPVRRALNIGGRKSRPGMSAPLDKAPQVKQGPALGVPRRIPGTTKVQYTNAKGRSFSFSIPVTQLTHPPTIRESPSPQGWREIDTSFADTGELEEDMPSPVQDFLRRHTVTRGELVEDVASAVDDVDGEFETYLKLDEDGLRELQRLFVDMCREYVLMDTQGMKTSLSFAELNNGPDYEMYDRKVKRKRYWLAIRHRYEDIKEVLWPSSLLDGRGETGPESPVLSASEMFEAVVWLEAASTFCVRSHRAYDVADPEEFLPLNLAREVRVLATQVSAKGTAGDSFLMPPGLGNPAHDGPDEVSRVDNHERSDRLISCAALSAKYNVPFTDFLPRRADASHDAGGAVKAGHWQGCAARDGARAVLLALPTLRKPRDAIRVMSVLNLMSEPATGGASNVSPKSNACLVFTDAETGDVVDTDFAAALMRLCGERLFGTADALENVAEGELCAVMAFLVQVHEQNAAFLKKNFADNADGAARCQETLEAFTRLAVARCRYLLYRLGGPQTTVMSGDDEFIPFVNMQQDVEGTNPQAFVHYKIGMENAMGLRFARLRASSSATLVELLDRLESAGGRPGVRTLVTDLVQHVAQKAAMGKDNLSVDDIIRVLPLLGKLRTTQGHMEGRVSPPREVTQGLDRLRTRYDRLFSAISTAIGAEMQRGQVSSAKLVDLLEGLAAAGYVPSSFNQMEMVLLRLSLLQSTSLSEMRRALEAMARLVGPHRVSQGVMQAAAAMVMDACHAQTPTPAPTAGLQSHELTEALHVAKLLYRCHYGAFPSLVVALKREGVIRSRDDAAQAARGARDQAVCGVLCAFAAGSLPESDPDCAELSDMGKALLGPATAQLGAEATETDDAVPLEGELLVDVLVSSAALGVPVDAPTLRAVETAAGLAGDVEKAAHLPSLVQLCTPVFAVSVLESIEALSLPADCAIYKSAAAFVKDVLAQLEVQQVAEGEKAPQGILPDDAAVAVRVLYLSHVGADIKASAAAILEREVVRLDEAVSSGSSGQDHAQPLSFEKRSLAQREAASQAEHLLLQYCAAIDHGRGAVDSAEAAA